MVNLNARRTGKIGYRSSHFQNAAIGSGRQTETLHRHSEHGNSLVVGFGIRVNHALRHLCIAVHTLDIAKPFGLNFTRTNNALADFCTPFALFSTADVLQRHGSYRALNIDTVEQRA